MMWQEKYNKGIDQMLEENFVIANYDKVCYSIKNNQYNEKDKDYSIVLFNQSQYLMKPGCQIKMSNYFLSR